MNSADVTIIGGGITGTAIARELSRFKLKVTLLEKEIELAFGVSKSNSGIIHPGTQNPPDSLKGKLCVRGNKLTRLLAAELGVDFKEVGELILAFTEEDIPRLQEIKKDAEKLGVPRLQVVDRAWLKEHEPNLNPAIPAALYSPTAGIISPYRLVYDLAENAVKNGVEIYYSRQVTGITKTNGGLEITAGGETFRSRFVINAAGLYADEISKMVGVSDFSIKPRKGEEFLLDRKRARLTNFILAPLPSPTSKGILVIRTSDGNPMLGPTAEEVESKDDLSTSDEGLKKVMESVRRMVPGIEEKDIIAYFAGLRPVAVPAGRQAGKDFIIRHEESVPGFINVAGIQSPGLTAAPAIAVMVVNLLGKSGLELTKKKDFQKHRPASVHLFSLSPEKIRQAVKEEPAYGDIVCRCEMVSAREVREAIGRGARTLDGIKFRTRAQAGRCHGGFCTTRLMKIMAEELKLPLTGITKKGPGSEIIRGER